jgi:hypothetical protein
MALFLDARIPVRHGMLSEAGPDDALVIEGDAAAPAGRPAVRFPTSDTAVPDATGPHAANCFCCAGRSAAATALGSLFLYRTRGDINTFRMVLVVTSSVAGRAAIDAALESDPVVSVRFRIGD